MKLLVTGAAGGIGTAFLTRHGSKYDLRLTDRKEPSEILQDMGEWVIGNTSDVDFVRRITEGVDIVLHLAANPSVNASIDSLLTDNIISSINVFECAEQAGVKRVVFASSVQAMVATPRDVQIRTDMANRPANLYGATKCFGEALCSVYSKKGISCIAVRIGAFSRNERLEKARHPGVFRLFVSHDDLCQLLDLCINAPEEIRYEIVHGVSDNVENWFDISSTRELLGYAPVDGAPAVPEELRDNWPKHQP